MKQNNQIQDKQNLRIKYVATVPSPLTAWTVRQINGQPWKTELSLAFRPVQRGLGANQRRRREGWLSSSRDCWLSNFPPFPTKGHLKK